MSIVAIIDHSPETDVTASNVTDSAGAIGSDAPARSLSANSESKQIATAITFGSEPHAITARSSSVDAWPPINLPLQRRKNAFI